MNNGNLEYELKKVVEGLHPDLRTFFRPSLLGKVVAVHDDDSDPESYYRVDVVMGSEPGRQADDESDAQGLSLPKVPVSALFAQNGYGIFALPEVGAEVTVSFHDGDVTRPYIESPIYYNSIAPSGFKAGTFAVVGKQGQKIILSPDTNEIQIIAGTVILGADNDAVLIGSKVKSLLNSIITILQTGSFLMGNMAAPTAPNPASAADFVQMLADLEQIVSSKIKMPGD